MQVATSRPPSRVRQVSIIGERTRFFSAGSLFFGPNMDGMDAMGWGKCERNSYVSSSIPCQTYLPVIRTYRYGGDETRPDWVPDALIDRERKRGRSRMWKSGTVIGFRRRNTQVTLLYLPYLLKAVEKYIQSSRLFALRKSHKWGYCVLFLNVARWGIHDGGRNRGE